MSFDSKQLPPVPTNVPPTASLDALERWDGTFPGHLEYKSLDNFIVDNSNPAHHRLMQVADRLLTDWEGSQFTGVHLYGDSGTGKSHAAIGIGRALHSVGADVFYRYIPAFTPRSTFADWAAPRELDQRAMDNVEFVSSLEQKAAQRIAQGSIEVKSTIIKRTGILTKTETEYLPDVPQPTDKPTESKQPIEQIIVQNPKSIFPIKYDKGIERNPKTVLILDELRPTHLLPARMAIEAAAQFGGLVIVTTNFGDVTTLAEPLESELTEFPSNYGLDEDEREHRKTVHARERAILRASFMSRVGPNFMQISFTGADQRPSESLWFDGLKPNDFE